MSQAIRMDRIYSLQRHIYDVTRRFYLLGRDRLLQDLPAPHSGNVLEVGCGTGRNLAVLGRMRSDLSLYGLDVSSLMLEKAQRKLRHANTRLANCRAEDLDCRAHFGLPDNFDAVFFSYVLSMIPTWEEALEAALGALKPGGTLGVVDFWGQGGLPPWLEALHKRWLSLFGVCCRPETLMMLRNMEKQGRIRLELDSVRNGYSYLAFATKTV